MRLIPLAVLLACLLAAPAAAAPPGFEPVGDPDLRRSFFGVSVLPPQGLDWFIASATKQHALGFFRSARHKKARKYRHSIVTVVDVRWERDCATPADCRQQALERAGREGEGLHTEWLNLLPDRPAPASCLRFRSLQEDQRVPEDRGRTYQVEVDGMVCTHPDLPRLTILAFTSQRFRKGGEVEATAFVEGARVVDSLRFEPVQTRIASFLDLGPAAADLASSAEGLWVVHRDQVSLVTTSGEATVRTLQVPGRSLALAHGHGSLWVGHEDQPVVYRLEPATGRVQATVALPAPASRLLATSRAVWAAAAEAGRVYRLDPDTNAVDGEITSAGGPVDLAMAGDRLWISDLESGAVIGVSPQDGKVLSRVRPCSTPTGLAAGRDGELWTGCFSEGMLVRIDIARDRVESFFDIGGSPWRLAVENGRVWVTHRDHGTISRVDPDGRTVQEVIPLGPAPFSAHLALGQVWVTDRSEGSLIGLTQARQRQQAVAGDPLRTSPAHP